MATSVCPSVCLSVYRQHWRLTYVRHHDATISRGGSLSSRLIGAINLFSFRRTEASILSVCYTPWLYRNIEVILKRWAPTDMADVQRVKRTWRSRSEWRGSRWTSEAMIVASSYANEVTVSWLQTLNVVANGMRVLDHMTPHHTTEVAEIAPLDYKPTSPNKTIISN